MEIRLKLNKKLMNGLKKSLELRTNGEIIAEALTFLEWAASEVEKGNEIHSVDAKGKATHVVTRGLLSVSAKARAAGLYV